MLNKTEHYQMKIDNLGHKGEGIGRIDNFAVFVEGVVVGDLIEVRIIKLNKTYAFGKLIKIIEPSEKRVEPKCKHYLKCGGCNLQQVNYSEQLELKQKKVYDCLTRIGGFKDISVNQIIGMENPYNYRNKAQFPVGSDGENITTGFYASNSHRIVDIDECCIQHPSHIRILEIVKEFMKINNIKPYDELSGKGLIRHILIKVGFTTDEIMVCLVINGNELPHSKALVESLKEIGEIKSISININTKKTNVILGEKIKIIEGKEYISDNIDNLIFNISPLSFFQVNPIQTQILYDTALSFAETKNTDTVVDAYCGIGSISLYFARNAKKVFGIEVVPEAIKDANENMKLNNISNAEFILGQVEDVLPKLSEELADKVDILVVDPPRKGCEPQFLNSVLKMHPEKIIYISCEPSTLARDLKILCGDDKYEISRVQPVDLFPMTYHVETICLIERVK